MTGYFPPAAAQKAARKPARTGWALRLGPSMVSLSALLWAAPALAQTTISTNSTAPLATSKSGDITINGGASVKPASGAAVTVDSNNLVANNGLIQFQDVDNATGILVKGGFTGSVFNNGTIQVDENFSAPTNDSGIPHGPIAKGTGRYGIRLVGPGDFTGDIFNGSTGGGISVKGNNSYGISLESNLVGQLTNVGTLSVTGDNTVGIRTTGNVSGTVTVGGNISATGLGAQAVNLGGDVGGQVLINGSVASTGYSFTSRSTSTSFLKQLQADNLLQGGPTVTVGGSVAKGIVVDISSVDSAGAALTSTGTISSISSAPALLVGGAAGHNITLGNVDATTAPFGLDIRGTVVGSGIYDGKSATAVQLGVTDGGAVDTSGGIRVSGTVGASAYAASATAMHLNGGVTAPVIRNDGAIVGTMSSDAQGATARGILIEAGANVQALLNADSISASVAGQKADVAAVVDRSGTLSEVENVGTIAAGRTFTDINQPVTGHNIAL
ncbi:MAG TPA: autotransporter domain-containing protein, partial [Caulobacteraceae bacterium]|nr:autotransporter domain-containing protein [Caulobacteraceae bacterium]